jgi:cysteine-rich repeat protein
MQRVWLSVVGVIVGTCYAISMAQAGAYGTITLEKTAQTGGLCSFPGAPDPLTVVPNTLVHYCYAATNNTGMTLTTHSLVDSVIGPIIVGSVCDNLGPGATCLVASGSNSTTADIMNVATWTAMTGSTVFSDTDSAQVFVKAANDECASATVIMSDTTLPFMDMIDTSLISHSTGEQPDPSCDSGCDWGALHSVWYKFFPPMDGTACVHTCGSGYDTVLSAYDSCGKYATEFECNNDFGHGCDAQSAIALHVTENVPVFIRVSSCSRSTVGPLQLKLDYCSIELDKTVSKDGSCPGTDTISVPNGTEVTYCYKVTNNSPITLTVHALEDSVLGSIFPGILTTDIGPNGGMFITSSTYTIGAMTMNVATWTSTITGDGRGITDTDSAKVFICGDGVTDNYPGPEDCDDGNTANGDCCSSMCMFESGSCSDGDKCTLNDTCEAGSCVGTPKDCPDLDECNAGVCNPSDGSCGTQPLTGTPCVNGVNAVSVTCFSEKGMCDNGTCKVTAADTDKDGICDEDDVRPSAFDPSGYFYNESTAKIVPGGKVVVSRIGAGVGVVTTIADGSAGFYKYEVSGLTSTEETYGLAITPPPDCALSIKCKPQLTAFDPSGMGNPVVLGNYPSGGNPMFLTSNACTNWYTTFEFESGDPDVINNNIPVVCIATPAPAMSLWGLALLSLALTAAAFWAIRRTAVKHP